MKIFKKFRKNTKIGIAVKPKPKYPVGHYFYKFKPYELQKRDNYGGYWDFLDTRDVSVKLSVITKVHWCPLQQIFYYYVQLNKNEKYFFSEEELDLFNKKEGYNLTLDKVVKCFRDIILGAQKGHFANGCGNHLENALAEAQTPKFKQVCGA